MSGTISTLPGCAGTSEELADGSSGAGGLGAAAAFHVQIGRMIELYRRFGSAPMQAIDDDALRSIIDAMDRGHEQDALDLLAIALEPMEPDFDEEVGTTADEFGSPFPEIVQVWRHSPKPPLVLVGGKDSPGRGRPKPLTPQRGMAMDTHDDWVIDMGDIDVDLHSRKATLELCGKGELLLLLRSGELAIQSDDASFVTDLVCSSGETRLARIVYACGRSRLGPSSLKLQIEATGAFPLNGVWCRSERKAASSTHDAPEEDVLHLENFGPIGSATDNAFHSGAVGIRSGREYKHKAAEERGDFARFKLEAQPAPSAGRMTLNVQDLSSRVNGIMAVSESSPAATSAPDRGAIGRELVEHMGDVEVIVAHDGVVWVAVSPEKAKGPDDDPEQRILTPSRDADGLHQSAFITPLMNTLDGGFDVMLLRPGYGHSVWTTPGSQSRFVHLTFDDPGKIVASHKPVGQAKSLARTTGRSVGGR